MFKRTALAVLAALAAVLCCSLSSCKGAGPEQEESVPYYTTDYVNDIPGTSWDLLTGSDYPTLDNCISASQLIARIRILGISSVVKSKEKSLPLSVYVGEVIEEYKNGAERVKYVYITRPGSSKEPVDGVPILKPGQELILFLTPNSAETRCTESPLYRFSCGTFFQELFICEYKGKEYVLPYAMMRFLPEGFATVPEELAAEIDKYADLNCPSVLVCEYKTVKEYINKALSLPQ
ncbi:MAG: hypothetical protein J5760_00100 [Clostridia bacterium]|nr:hypothetical protein [Clostridia bacterium]